jgi:hypothetical protein
MTGKEQLVRQVLENHPELWQAPWRAYCLSVLADAARNSIACLSPFQLIPTFSRLDDPAFRADAVNLECAVTDVVAVLAEPGSLREKVDGMLAAHSSRLRSREVAGVASQCVREHLMSVEANGVLASVRPAEVYRALAHKLAAELHRRVTAGEDMSENELLTMLLLMNYLCVWELPAGKLAGWISQQAAGPTGIRGVLLGLPGLCGPDGLAEAPPSPPLTMPRGISIPAALAAQSCLLASVQHESARIADGQGFMHRVCGLNEPLFENATAALQQRGISIGDWAWFRDDAYRQYEYYSLLFSAVAGIEFLVRSCSPTSSAGTGDVPALVDGLRATLGDSLALEITGVFDSDRLNLRNRAVHGVFLDIEARRLERAMASGRLEHLGVRQLVLTNASLMPESVASYVVQLLDRVAAALACQTLGTGWVSEFIPAPHEMAFAHGLHCDVLQSSGAAEAWPAQISAFLRHACPCLNSPLRLGMSGWFAREGGVGAVPSIAFLCLLLEPAIRMVLGRLGVPVIQRSPQRTGCGDTVYHFQYHMLDDRGLLSPGNLDMLTRHLAEGEREAAKRTLRLAAKTRDAVAHGAVLQMTEDFRIAQGHLVIKAIQLLSTVQFPH